MLRMRGFLCIAWELGLIQPKMLNKLNLKPNRSLR